MLSIGCVINGPSILRTLESYFMPYRVSKTADNPPELCGVCADEGAEGDVADADRLYGHRARLGLHHLLYLRTKEKGA